MTEMNLEVAVRQEKGRRVAKRLRREGVTPGVMYGLKEPVSLQMDTHTTNRLFVALHGSGRMITLKISGDKGAAKEHKVLIKEVQTRAVGDEILHVDFQEVDVTKTVSVSVPVRPIGKSEGERLGGILQAILHEVQVECLPTEIPEFLEADVAKLDMGHSLHVSDLNLPKGVKALTSEEETLFVVISPAKMEVDASEDEAVEGEESEGDAAAEEGAEEKKD